jgi:uncharacterized protein YfaS (alpha-2-macroglobulin family)
MVERFIEVRDYTGKQPGKPSYDSIDLSRYLQTKSSGARGLFLLRVRAVSVTQASEPASRRDADSDSSEAEGSDSGYDPAGIQDTRLILITDLGFIVKQSKDGSRDVFVQSIHTGQPVDGVRIEALGRNGQAVVAATTENRCRRLRDAIAQELLFALRPPAERFQCAELASRDGRRSSDGLSACTLTLGELL